MTDTDEIDKMLNAAGALLGERDTEMSDAFGAALDSFEHQAAELVRQRDKLRDALQNIMNGIDTGDVKVVTAQDETWANAMRDARSALAAAGKE